MFAGKQCRNSRTVKVEKAAGSSCLVSLMDAEMFRGRRKPCFCRGERISPSSENQELEEGREQRCRALFIFFFFLIAFTLHLKNPKTKSSVWKDICVRKFFHINLQLLWFRNTTFWCSEIPFDIVNHPAIAWGLPQSPLNSGKGTHHLFYLVSCSNGRIGPPRPEKWE